MTYAIKSQKAGKTFTTKDPLKDAQWGNQYYGVDDCVVEVVAELTKEQIEKTAQIANLKAMRDRLEKDIAYSQLTGDMYDETTSWADKKKADWLALRQQIRDLENGHN